MNKLAKKTASGSPARHVQIAPSVLAADLGYLERDIRRAEAAGADVLHLDIMDGNFVPNISFGTNLVRTIDRLTTLPLDVHLMIVEPQRFLAEFAAAGADMLTVHIEACVHIHRVLEEIRSLNVRPGVALNPGTGLETLSAVWPQIELLLLMSVNPGFGGQSFIPEVLPKITAARAELDRRSSAAVLAVDGGLNRETSVSVVRAGATQLVMGTFLFQSTSMKTTLTGVRAQCSKP